MCGPAGDSWPFKRITEKIKAISSVNQLLVSTKATRKWKKQAI